jgi:hypothetical protein
MAFFRRRSLTKKSESFVFWKLLPNAAAGLPGGHEKND